MVSDPRSIERQARKAELVLRKAHGSIGSGKRLASLRLSGSAIISLPHQSSLEPATRRPQIQSFGKCLVSAEPTAAFGCGQTTANDCYVGESGSRAQRKEKCHFKPLVLHVANSANRLIWHQPAEPTVLTLHQAFPHVHSSMWRCSQPKVSSLLAPPFFDPI